jgi:hypothetical protein
MPAVIIRIEDQNSTGVQNIGVRVYDGDNVYLQDSGYTDAAGEAAFVLTEGTYYVRLDAEHLHVTLDSLGTIRVITPPPDNTFEVDAVIFEVAPPPSPDLCRVYGWLNYATLHPRATILHFSSLEDPTVMLSVGELGSQLPVATDDDGYLQVDLVRDTLLSVIVPGYEEDPIIFRVPNVPTTRLEDLLFPVPTLLTFDPAGPLVLAVGDVEELVDSSLTLSSLVVLDGTTSEDTSISRYITYESSDTAVATAGMASDGTPTITAIGAGTALITAVLVDDTYPIRRPVATLAMSPVAGVSVTVN